MEEEALTRIFVVIANEFECVHIAACTRRLDLHARSMADEGSHGSNVVQCKAKGEIPVCVVKCFLLGMCLRIVFLGSGMQSWW